MGIDILPDQMRKQAAAEPEVRSAGHYGLRSKIWYLFNLLLLLVGATAMILPFYWMVSTSFKTPPETVAIPPTLIPKVFTWLNYESAFSRIDIPRLYLNTTFVTLVRLVVTLYTSLLLGYIFAKFRFWGRNFLFYLILGTMIIPLEVYMIPLYVMVVKAKLGNTYMAIALPTLFSAYCIFMVRQFMYSIPSELIDAARIDGAGEFHIFHRIVAPLAQPVMVTLGALLFMWYWHDFLWPLIILTDSAKYVFSVGLATFVGENFTEYGVIMAGSTMATMPILLVFVALQKYIIGGIGLSGMK
jgi:ABC-type glycerol-3-phosphate transport system permease component